MLTRCYCAFVLSILEYCSPVWGSAAECHIQLLGRQVYSVARRCPDQTFSSLCHLRNVCSTVYVVESYFELESYFVQ